MTSILSVIPNPLKFILCLWVAFSLSDSRGWYNAIIDYRSWAESENLDNLSGYESYLATSNAERFREEAKTRVTRILAEQHANQWSQASASDVIEEYEKFLADHPRSRMRSDALGRIRELHWAQAQLKDTEESYQDHIDKYPSGDSSKKARVRLEVVVWNRVSISDSLAANMVFERKFPNSIHVETVRDNIHRLTWEHAKERDEAKQYLNFLNRFPDSHYAPMATTALAEIDLLHKSRHANNAEVFEIRQTMDQSEDEGYIGYPFLELIRDNNIWPVSAIYSNDEKLVQFSLWSSGPRTRVLEPDETDFKLVRKILHRRYVADEVGLPKGIVLFVPQKTTNSKETIRKLLRSLAYEKGHSLEKVVGLNFYKSGITRAEALVKYNM